SMKSAGAILLGKTNVPERGIPYECENPDFGRTNNPRDLSKTSGGSSGGEAAAISACLSPVGLGSDLSGSIRVPAHFCGIVDLKPARCRLSSAGHFPPIVGTLSDGAVIGPMARYVEDLSLLLSILTKADLANFAEKQSKITSDSLRGWRVAAFMDEHYAPVSDETRDAVQSALRALSAAGLVIVEEKPPGFERAIDYWPALFARITVVQLRELYKGQEELAGTNVRAVVASMDKAPPPTIEEHVKMRVELSTIYKTLIEWMQATPFIIAPVGAVGAFEHGARRVEVNGKSI